MKVLEKYVLIEQTMVKKQSSVILLEEAKEEDKFDYSFKIIQLGDECKNIFTVGDTPVFRKHVQFEGFKIVEKDDNRMVGHVLVHEDDIIAIDNEEIY